MLADSLDKAWKAVTDAVQDARANARMKQVSYASKFFFYSLCLGHAPFTEYFSPLTD